MSLAYYKIGFKSRRKILEERELAEDILDSFFQKCRISKNINSRILRSNSKNMLGFDNKKEIEVKNKNKTENSFSFYSLFNYDFNSVKNQNKEQKLLKSKNKLNLYIKPVLHPKKLFSKIIFLIQPLDNFSLNTKKLIDSSFIQNKQRSFFEFGYRNDNFFITQDLMFLTNKEYKFLIKELHQFRALFFSKSSFFFRNNDLDMDYFNSINVLLDCFFTNIGYFKEKNNDIVKDNQETQLLNLYSNQLNKKFIKIKKKRKKSKNKSIK
uniref:Uncharacterized protein n=1 Tax=Prototheca stagnorum TaxID=215448 RepID=A0A2Z6BEN7_9CHLO|nr:hypothetical protein [Prototheca stagnorum]BBD20187.1 hypothetical protein [Prototheca stagnorum]